MPANFKKVVIIAAFAGAGTVAVAFITVRASRTEIDSVVSDAKERHTCSHCGHSFLLSISEAVTMRRSHGDIDCPQCGKTGATKDGAMASTDLIRPNAQDDQAGEDNADDETSAQRRKHPKPTATLSREPVP